MNVIGTFNTQACIVERSIKAEFVVIDDSGEPLLGRPAVMDL